MMTDQTEKKRLTHARIQTVLLVCIVVLLLVVALTAIRGIDSLQRTLTLTQEKLDTLNMDDINRIVSALQGITAQLRELDLSHLDETADALGRAAENLDDVDIDTFNAAVNALKDAASKFQKIDIDALNTVAKALGEATEKLQGAVEKASGLMTFFH